MSTRDTIKKGEEFLSIDEQGFIKKIRRDALKRKTSHKEKSFDLNYLNIGYYIITPLLLGVFLGLVLDNWFKTKPIFVAIGIVMGTTACFYNLYKLLKNG